MKSVLSNGTLWLDVFLTKNGVNPNPHDSSFSFEDVHHVRKRKFTSICFREDYL